jgi:hypothetical protein
MKRAATAAPSVCRRKKAKIAKKQAKKTSTQPLQSMSMGDVIDLVASQAADEAPAGDEDAESTAGPSEDGLDGDALVRDATIACKHLHAEIAKLTMTVEQQQKTIHAMEITLTKVLSILQQSNTQLQTAAAAPAAVGDRKTLGAVGSGSRNNRPAFRRAQQGVDDRRDPDRGQVEETDTGADLTLIVHRTLNDVARRKRNVIITGLEEESGDGARCDQELFEDFCEDFMHVKPAVAYGGKSCIRIGGRVRGGPRRLLVRLQSEEGASALLEAAPSLRHCHDVYVAANVFINPDLSPSAAKLAYQARLRRREGRDRNRRLGASVFAAVDGEDYATDVGASTATASSSASSRSSAVVGDVTAAPLQRSGSVRAIVNALNANAPSWDGAASTVTASQSTRLASARAMAAAITAQAEVGHSTIGAAVGDHPGGGVASTTTSVSFL